MIRDFEIHEGKIAPAYASAAASVATGMGVILNRASKQFALGTDRNTSVKIIAEGKQIVCDATIGEVTSFGGATLDVNNFGCTLYFNGQPTVSTAET